MGDVLAPLVSVLCAPPRIPELQGSVEATTQNHLIYRWEAEAHRRGAQPNGLLLPVLPSLTPLPSPAACLGPVTGLVPGPCLALGFQWLPLLRALLLPPKPSSVGLSPPSPVCLLQSFPLFQGAPHRPPRRVHTPCSGPSPPAQEGSLGEPEWCLAQVSREAPWGLRNQLVQAGQR